MSFYHSSNLSSNYYIKVIGSILISLVYATLLSNLPNSLFRDRENYVTYATYSVDLLENYSSLSYFFNEPLFLYYNSVLSYFFPVDIVPRVGVFFISFTLAYFILIYASSFLKVILGFLLLFFVSYTFHLQLVVLRQGIATAIFIYLVHFFWGQKKFYPLCFVLAFIHSSFFIITAVLIYDKILSYYIKNVKTKIIIISASILFLSLILLKVAADLGVRQATEDHLLSNENGGGGFVLFAFIFIFLFFRGLNNVYSDKYGRIAILGLIIYLMFYYTLPISGRIIATFLPFIYIYIVSSKNLKITFAGIAFLLVNIYLFPSSIKGGSLSLEGVRYLEYLL